MPESWRVTIEGFRLLVLCGVVIAAAYGDLRLGKIPNGLTLSAVVAGVLLSAPVGGWDGMIWSVWGLVAGAGPLLVVYMIGVAGRRPLMGAGDVKLMAGVGCFAGPLGALWSLYYGLWVAGLLALGIVGYWLIRRDRTLSRTIPFGACLAFGALIGLVFRGPAFSLLTSQISP